jgi:hypothetical protein
VRTSGAGAPRFEKIWRLQNLIKINPFSRKGDRYEVLSLCRPLLIGLLLLAVSSTSFAAVTANSVVTAQTPNNGKQNFVQGTDSAGTYKTIYTAGSNGSKCNGITVANDDASATHVMTFEIVNGGTSYHFSTFTTTSPASGSYSTANAITTTNWAGLPTDSDGNPYIQLISGDVLKATFATALTSADEIDVFASCADF